MANHKSAIKRHLQSTKKRATNRQFKNKMNTYKKKTIDEQKKNLSFKDQIKLKKEISIIQKSIKKGILHKNRAAKKISKLMKNNI